jgi:hypothetical protein
MTFGVLVTLALACLLLVVIRLVTGIGQAKKGYDDSLEELKGDPHNSDLREKVLALGRQYAGRLHAVGLGKVFDEAALRNDVDAALVEAESKFDTDAANPRPSVKQRLSKLEALRKKDLVTDAEYRRRRQEILKDRRTG